MTMTSSQAAARARTLADNLKADIPNAQTRIEHMRLVRLWNEADSLATELEQM